MHCFDTRGDVIIDTHSHIDLPVFQNDFQQVLDRARQAGVRGQVLPGVTRTGWERILSLSETEVDLFSAIGLHPMYLAYHGREDLKELDRVAASGRVVAIGEVGLDYYTKNVNRAAQQELFEAQLAIAKKYSLPVLLHVRKAHDQVQATLRRVEFTGGGIVHAFSGSLQQAEHYIKLGFLISVCGTITYDRATRIRAVAMVLPLDSLVVETDSPDISPASHHGERNSPENLIETVTVFAELRALPVQRVINKTSHNARLLLGI